MDFLKEEEDKRTKWKRENLRRKTDLTPMVLTNVIIFPAKMKISVADKRSYGGISTVWYNIKNTIVK